MKPKFGCRWEKIKQLPDWLKPLYKPQKTSIKEFKGKSFRYKIITLNTKPVYYRRLRKRTFLRGKI